MEFETEHHENAENLMRAINEDDEFEGPAEAMADGTLRVHGVDDANALFRYLRENSRARTAVHWLGEGSYEVHFAIEG